MFKVMNYISKNLYWLLLVLYQYLFTVPVKTYIGYYYKKNIRNLKYLCFVLQKIFWNLCIFAVYPIGLEYTA